MFVEDDAKVGYWEPNPLHVGDYVTIRLSAECNIARINTTFGIGGNGSITTRQADGGHPQIYDGKEGMIIQVLDPKYIMYGHIYRVALLQVVTTKHADWIGADFANIELQLMEDYPNIHQYGIWNNILEMCQLLGINYPTHHN